MSQAKKKYLPHVIVNSQLLTLFFFVFSREERRIFAQAGLASVRRKGVTLFQYKYYSEQLPLTLSHEEMDLLVDTIANPPDDDHQSCLIASKIIIKVL